MSWETGRSSAPSEGSSGLQIGKGERQPIRGRRVAVSSEDEATKGEKSRPLGNRGPELLPEYRAGAKFTPVAAATPGAEENKGEQGSLSPARRLSDFELNLIGLVGTKVPALLIPADSSRPVTRVEFDQDKLLRYKAVRYDENRVFLTKKNAERDQAIPVPNSRASDYVKNHSDAAKYPDSRLPPPEDLYDDVYVVARDPLLDMITDLTKQLTDLKRTLEWMDPLSKSD